MVISLVFHAQVAREDAVPLAKDQRGAELREASRDGFRAGMLLAAGLAFLGATVAGVGISNREARGEQVSEPEPAPAGGS
jgi:hypothetical protein